MTDKYPKRLIEVDLPIKRISAHASREKSIRHGHISTLHIWWARRPLAACRAVICAALWPDPADPLCPQTYRDESSRIILEFAKAAVTNKQLSESCDPQSWAKWQALAKRGGFDSRKEGHWTLLRFALLDFIADFSNWDNSTVQAYLQTSQALTRAAHEALGGEPGTRPLVVDPFAGGGSIPLEALRVGADAFASDLNPIPVLLNKVVLEYIPTYGETLAQEVRRWGDWVKEESARELIDLYPNDEDGATPIAYLWARTIRCEGPGCGAEIPLFNSHCLAQTGKRSTFLKMLCNKRTKKIDFEITSNAPAESEIAGVLRRSSVTCPICGYTTKAANVRAQFQGRKGGSSDARLLAVVTTMPGQSGRTYRLPNLRDLDIAQEASRQLELIRTNSPDEVPDEPLPYLRSIFNIQLLDATKWSYLFSPRQLLSLVLLIRVIRRLAVRLENSGVQSGLQAAICTCLAMAIDRVASQFSSLTRWQPKGEFSVGTFGRQALGIIWDFVEIRPVGGASGDLDGAIDWICRVIGSGVEASGMVAGTAQLASATSHPLPDDSAAALVTDPPYYDAVPYADLSDFFYVFLKRMLKKQHPFLFESELSPKVGEIVQLAERNPMYAYKTKDYFEKGMQDALAEGRRVTVPSGIGVIVFAHKTTQGWEVMLSSVIKAGWIVTASWPIDTERSVRPRANNSAALGSSVHLVCRPREYSAGATAANEVGDWRDVLQELPRRIHEWMPRLASEGVVGADAIFACLGPALEIFSRHSRVEKASGEAVGLGEYLEQVWATVAREALSLVFEGANATGFEADARLTAMWLWTFKTPDVDGVEDDNPEDLEVDESESERKLPKVSGFKLEYDAARKIAQGLGANLEDLAHLVQISGDQARLLPVSERTRHLFGKEEEEPTRMSGKKRAASQLDMFAELTESTDAEAAWTEKTVKRIGETTLDRIHQAMILFAAGRAEALKRFVIEDGVGRDDKFWRLAQALSALYPAGTDEKRWVDGVLARKKQFGF